MGRLSTGGGQFINKFVKFWNHKTEIAPGLFQSEPVSSFDDILRMTGTMFSLARNPHQPRPQGGLTSSGVGETAVGTAH